MTPIEDFKKTVKDFNTLVVPAMTRFRQSWLGNR